MELYRNRAELQLFTTLQCNLSCSYCSLREGSQLNSQGKPTYSIQQLKEFVATCLGDRELLFTFYGGEPLLNRDFIFEVIEAFPFAKFQLQTNGTLLAKTDNDIICRMSNILVSLDGSEKHTDEARGAGVYSKVLAHVKELSDRDRFTASTIGRVTWSSPDTSMEELDEMLKTFDYVYFQFAHKIGAYGLGSLQKRKFELRRLVEKFFTYHSVYCMIPIMGIVRNKLFPHKAVEVCGGKTQCRASTHLYNVLPNGDIYACPDMTHMSEMYMGNIAKKELRDSPLQATDKFPCWTCEAYKWCRHTCIKNLHVAYTLGDINHRIGITEPVCELTRFLGQEIDKHDLASYFKELTPADQEHLKNAAVYDYVEIMP
jgi:radical SAM protein with 4Fe4S-binding SPASM domain